MNENSDMSIESNESDMSLEYQPPSTPPQPLPQPQPSPPLLPPPQPQPQSQPSPQPLVTPSKQLLYSNLSPIPTYSSKSFNLLDTQSSKSSNLLDNARLSILNQNSQINNTINLDKLYKTIFKINTIFQVFFYVEQLFSGYVALGSFSFYLIDSSIIKIIEISINKNYIFDKILVTNVIEQQIDIKNLFTDELINIFDSNITNSLSIDLNQTVLSEQSFYENIPTNLFKIMMNDIIDISIDLTDKYNSYIDFEVLGIDRITKNGNDFYKYIIYVLFNLGFTSSNYNINNNTINFKKNLFDPQFDITETKNEYLLLIYQIQSKINNKNDMCMFNFSLSTTVLKFFKRFCNSDNDQEIAGNLILKPILQENNSEPNIKWKLYLDKTTSTDTGIKLLDHLKYSLEYIYYGYSTLQNIIKNPNSTLSENDKTYLDNILKLFYIYKNSDINNLNITRGNEQAVPLYIGAFTFHTHPRIYDAITAPPSLADCSVFIYCYKTYYTKCGFVFADIGISILSFNENFDYNLLNNELNNSKIKDIWDGYDQLRYRVENETNSKTTESKTEIKETYINTCVTIANNISKIKSSDFFKNCKDENPVFKCEFYSWDELIKKEKTFKILYKNLNSNDLCNPSLSITKYKAEINSAVYYGYDKTPTLFFDINNKIYKNNMHILDFVDKENNKINVTLNDKFIIKLNMNNKEDPNFYYKNKKYNISFICFLQEKKWIKFENIYTFFFKLYYLDYEKDFDNMIEILKQTIKKQIDVNQKIIITISDQQTIEIENDDKKEQTIEIKNDDKKDQVEEEEL